MKTKRPYDKKTVTWLVLMHAGCLFAPFTFTWEAFWLFIVLYIITGGVGISLGYHRLLSHRSFKVPKSLEYFISVLGCLAAQRSPIYWVARHRQHHAQTDHEGDPHTPLQGFFWSHMAWCMADLRVEDENAYYQRYAPELAKDPGHRFIQKTHELWPLLLALALFLWGGFSFLVWGVFVRTVAVYHGTWIVNSAGHKWGYKSYKTPDESRNNPWIALMTFGDGWHNNHHACQSSARHGHRWWEIDPTYYAIRLLAFFKLARNIRPVRCPAFSGEKQT